MKKNFHFLYSRKEGPAQGFLRFFPIADSQNSRISPNFSRGTCSAPRCLRTSLCRSRFTPLVPDNGYLRLDPRPLPDSTPKFDSTLHGCFFVTLRLLGPLSSACATLGSSASIFVLRREGLVPKRKPAFSLSRQDLARCFSHNFLAGKALAQNWLKITRAAWQLSSAMHACSPFLIARNFTDLKFCKNLKSFKNFL